MNQPETGSPPISLLLPERVRLFHIGIPKTGTTALQQTAARKKNDLLAHGVLYPVAREINHRHEVSAFMGRRLNTGEVPPRSLWDELQRVIQADVEHRVWIDHEWASESSDEMAAAFCDALSGSLHIVVTLRNFGEVLVSRWQQYMKHGIAMSRDEWLRAVLTEPPRTEVTPDFHLCADQARVVRRWAEIVGPENVTVIVTDKARPTLISDGFEDLLGLPRGFLDPGELDGYASNRSMSFQEAELFRAINSEFPEEGNERPYSRYIRNGAASHLLRNRRLGQRDLRIELPSWAVDRTSGLGHRYADEIATIGVRVIGSLDLLRVPVQPERTPPPEPLDVPLDLATTVVLGAIDAGQRYERVLRERGKAVAEAADTVIAQAKRDVQQKTRELERMKARAQKLAGELRELKAKGPAMSTVRATGLLVEFTRRVWRRIRPR